MSEPEVAALQAQGYRPSAHYEADPQLKASLDLIASGVFAGGDPRVFETVVATLLHHDRFMALADYRTYLDAQARVDAYYADETAWTRSVILNVARSGYFSSDRSLRDDLTRIWHTQPVM